MNLFFRSFCVQKAGNVFGECEDRVWVYPPHLNRQQGKFSISHALLRFGVADGATEGMFSRVWAEILVKTFCRFKADDVAFEAVIEKASKDWKHWIGNYLQKRQRHNRPLKWYEEEGLKKGSFSTLLGFTLVEGKEPKEIGRRWRAVAVGDTCLFQVRDDALLVKFPVNGASEFSNSPFLICSNPLRNRRVIEEAMKIIEGNWCIGDSFYLMTDALACWFLAECESGGSPWQLLSRSEENKESFEVFVNGLRDGKKMRNDDIALVHINAI